MNINGFAASHGAGKFFYLRLVRVYIIVPPLKVVLSSLNLRDGESGGPVEDRLIRTHVLW